MKHLAKEELNEKIQDGGNCFDSYHVQHWFNILWEQILEVKSVIYVAKYYVVNIAQYIYLILKCSQGKLFGHE